MIKMFLVNYNSPGSFLFTLSLLCCNKLIYYRKGFIFSLVSFHLVIIFCQWSFFTSIEKSLTRLHILYDMHGQVRYFVQFFVLCASSYDYICSSPLLVPIVHFLPLTTEYNYLFKHIIVTICYLRRLIILMQAHEVGQVNGWQPWLLQQFMVLYVLLFAFLIHESTQLPLRPLNALVQVGLVIFVQISDSGFYLKQLMLYTQ